MRPKLIHFLSSLVIFCSCATSYKTGVTPDDVYYSPVPVVETTDDSSNDNAQAPVNIDSVQQDRQITMGIQDSRWRNFGYDYDYYYSPYYNTYGYHSYGLNNYYYDNWYCYHYKYY